MSKDSATEDLENAIRLNERRRVYKRKPKQVRDLLNHIVASRGLAAVESSSQLQRIWDDAVGVKLANQTLVGALKRGTLEIVVANSSLMQQLSFKKRELLKQIKASAPEIKSLRFRIGKIG